MIAAAVASRIRLVAFDVDGTLTDNGVYIGAADAVTGDLERVELKRFDVQDGLGIVLLRRAGIVVAWLSARHSNATTLRAAELGITHLFQGKGLRKVPTLTALSTELGIALDEMAFMGDDLADIAAMQHVALSAAPSNAVSEVRAVASIQLSRAGGRGAAREFIEQLLRARNEWDDLVAAYVADSARIEAGHAS